MLSAIIENVASERVGNVYEVASVPWRDWNVRISWTVLHGVPTPVGLELIPTSSDPAPLTSTVLRDLPFGRLAQQTRLQVADGLQQWAEELLAQVPPEAPTLQRYIQDRTEHVLEPFRGEKRGRDLGDEMYRRVARVYAQALVDGENPTAAVEAAFTDVHNRSTAARRVKEAERRGYLSKTTRGRARRLLIPNEEQS